MGKRKLRRPGRHKARARSRGNSALSTILQPLAPCLASGGVRARVCACACGQAYRSSLQVRLRLHSGNTCNEGHHSTRAHTTHLATRLSPAYPTLARSHVAYFPLPALLEFECCAAVMCSVQCSAEPQSASTDLLRNLPVVASHRSARANSSSSLEPCPRTRSARLQAPMPTCLSPPTPLGKRIPLAACAADTRRGHHVIRV